MSRRRCFKTRLEAQRTYLWAWNGIWSSLITSAESISVNLSFKLETKWVEIFLFCDSFMARSLDTHWVTGSLIFINIREGFNKKKTLKVMEFSIQILPPLPLRRKKKSNPQFFYVFIMFIITKCGENFEDKIDICTKELKSKSLTAGHNFWPDPPSIMKK